MSRKSVLDSITPVGDTITARRQAFVDVAREKFFEHGYAATSMSSIAAGVGGSKTTLWTYFPSKESLFGAVVHDVINQYGKSLSIDLPVDEPVAEVLQQFGNALMSGCLAPPMLSLYRVVVAEAERFPDLAEIYYKAGPRIGKGRLADWMSEKMERGELRRGDALQATHDFVALCHGNIYPSAVFGLPGARKIGSRKISQAIESAVDCFCRAWGSQP